MTAAEKQQRHRDRKKAGIVMIRIPLDMDDQEALRAAGYLSALSEGTATELAEAVNACLRHVIQAKEK